MKLSLRWGTGAVADLLAIRNWQDAAWLDREAERFAQDGIGDVRIVRAPDGRRHLVLFVPGTRSGWKR